MSELQRAVLRALTICLVFAGVGGTVYFTEYCANARRAECIQQCTADMAETIAANQRMARRLVELDDPAADRRWLAPGRE